MTTATTSSTVLLRGLALAQALAIAVFGLLLLTRDGEPVPVPARAEAKVAGTGPAAPPESANALPTANPATAEATTAKPSTPPSTTAPQAVDTVLYGRVVDEAGTPLKSGFVGFYRGDEGRPFAQVSCDPRQPAFAIAGVQAGTIRYHARADGFREQIATIEVPAGAAQLRVDIVLHAAWVLAVKVLTPDGTPVATALRSAKERTNLFHVEVAAVATATRPESDFPPTGLREVRFGLGRWRGNTGFEARTRDKVLAKDVLGTIELDERRPVWVSAVLRHHVLQSVAVEPGQNEVTLTISLDQILRDLGTIRGRLVDGATGQPVAGASIDFGDLQSGGAGTKVGDDGTFAIRDLRPGLLDIEARTTQLAAHHDLVLLQPGQTLDLGDLPLWEFRTLKGRCEGRTGKPGEGRMYWFALTPPSHPAIRRNDGSTEIAADGSFQMYVPHGRYLVRATGTGGAFAELDTVAQGDAPLVLNLQKEAPLRVDIAKDADGLDLTLLDRAGRLVWHRDLPAGSKWPFLLPPGDYRAELRNGSGNVQTRTIKLGADGADLRVP